MHRSLRCTSLLLVIGPLALVLLACGFGSSVVGGVMPASSLVPMSTATPVPHATVVEVSDSKNLANSSQGPYTATASCPAGQPLLGDGFDEHGTTNAQQAGTLASYPTSASTWTLTGTNAAVGGPLCLRLLLGSQLSGHDQ
jgi:hypothetical protein